MFTLVALALDKIAIWWWRRRRFLIAIPGCTKIHYFSKVKGRWVKFE